MALKKTVSYLMSGPAHLHYLICSLYTLRQHYSCRVEVYAYPESFPYVQRIAQDDRLDIQPILWTPEYTSKNSQFLNKILMVQRQTADVRVYLDADTTIHGSIMPLFDACQTSEMNATQFNDWLTNGRLVRPRIERLRQFKEIDSNLIDLVLNNPKPSPNGGVFSVRPSAGVLKHWYDWSWASKSIFICDESVLQILQAAYDKEKLNVIEGGQFNYSHRYGNNVKDPVICHYHGDSCLRPNKSQKACDTWWPIYIDCLEQNIGDVQNWRAHVKHRFMQDLKSDPRYSPFIV